jgi:hypothetical protein
MAGVLDAAHSVAMNSRTEFSIQIVNAALTVEILAFSPDGDPLAMVPIAKCEALALIAMPVTMGHVFRAPHVGNGRVFVEAIEAVQRS